MHSVEQSPRLPNSWLDTSVLETRRADVQDDVPETHCFSTAPAFIGFGKHDLELAAQVPLFTSPRPEALPAQVSENETTQRPQASTPPSDAANDGENPWVRLQASVRRGAGQNRSSRANIEPVSLATARLTKVLKPRKHKATSSRARETAPEIPAEVKPPVPPSNPPAGRKSTRQNADTSQTAVTRKRRKAVEELLEAAEEAPAPRRSKRLKTVEGGARLQRVEAAAEGNGKIVGRTRGVRTTRSAGKAAGPKRGKGGTGRRGNA